jgi:zinc protease
MSNKTPLILTLLLVILALVLSLRENKQDKQETSKSPTTPTSQTSGSSEPSEKSDIPTDTAATFGKLGNGMSYIILPNTEPPQRLSLRLHVAAGSLMEQDNQKGVAHFLEHMVFNGTKNFENANALIREMQSRGIQFGAGVNAYTSFDETVYMLDLPDLKSNNLDLTFKIMRDFADGALLSDQEIDEERGVILSEKRARDTVSSRMIEKQFNTLLPDSLIPKRFPIGTDEIIQNAPREVFLDFYQKYYFPSNMTFIVVGDIDPSEVQQRIQDTFGSLQNPEKIGEQPDLGTISPPENLLSHVFSDPELESTDISLLLVRPYEFQPDTRANRTSRIPLFLAHSIIDRRFDRLSKIENSPISSGSASKDVWFNEIEFGSVSVTAADDRWQDATSTLEQEFRRALEHGFTESELIEAKANLLNQYEEAVKSKDTRKSESLATAIARSINSQTVFSTPETNLEIIKSALETVTIDTLHTHFQEFWKSPGYHLVLSTKSSLESDKDTLLNLYQESSKTPVEPPADRKLAPFAYTDLGDPGTVSSQNEIEDLGITQITLSNNIRINLKTTDFEKNSIRILARIGSGQLTQPADKPLLNAVASSLFNAGGLGKHSIDELSEILAGKNIASALSIGEDAFILSGSTTPSDQLLQLQYMVASITDPGYRQEALWQFQKQIPAIFQNLKHTVAGPGQELNAWLYGNDPRYTIPSQTVLSNYTIDDVKSWLTPELQSSYLELSIIGDFQKDQIIKDLLATFGTLPTREEKPAESTPNPRTVTFPAPPQEKTFTYESKIPQAVATAVWKAAGMRNNIPEVRRLNVLSAIYDDRIREEIREKLGASYSPNAGLEASDALENYGYIQAQSMGKPDDIPLILSSMESIATELSKNGASQEELDRALAPTLKSLEKTLRDNSYWLSTVLSQSQADPKRLDLARNREADYKSITLKEINKLAKK